MSPKRQLTLGDVLSRQRRGLPPFPTKEEWEGIEEYESEAPQRNTESRESDTEPRIEPPVALPLLKKLNDELREINGRERPSVGAAISAIARAFASYQNVPESEKQAINKDFSEAFGPAAKLLGLQSQVDEILTVGTVVVVYRPKLLNMDPDQQQKIRNAITAILTANPNADLAMIQDSIGIKVLNVQRPAPPPSPDPGKSSDW